MPSQDTNMHGRRWDRLALLLLGLGLCLRLYYYLGNPSLWWDETAIILNVEAKGYADLAGPLDHAQSGPPFFLWLEKALGTWLGDSPWVWRAPALTASCLGLVLLWWAAQRLLPADGVTWAVALFAFSDRVLWHSVEAKPYTLDTLATISVLAVWLWTARWELVPRILLFAVLCPLLFCLSYPALFVCVGPALLLCLDAWGSRRVGAWLAYGLYLGAAAATGAWLVQGPIHGQQQGLLAAGFSWANQMPDWSRLDRACWWPLKAAFETLRYCFYPTGGLLIGFAAAGAWWLVRNRQGRLAILMLAPLLTVMLAAGLHRYPCGCARPMLFFTPFAALLIGCSVPGVLRRCLGVGVFSPPGEEGDGAGGRRWATALAGLATLGLALSPVALSLSRLVFPWSRADCRGAAAYVLSHCKAEDLVLITSWDQLYFYRHLDPCRRCSCAGLSEATGKRCWVTLGYPPSLAVERTAPWESVLTEQTGWAISAQQPFGELTLVLLERRGTNGERRPDEIKDPVPYLPLSSARIR